MNELYDCEIWVSLNFFLIKNCHLKFIFSTHFYLVSTTVIIFNLGLLIYRQLTKLELFINYEVNEVFDVLFAIIYLY